MGLTLRSLANHVLGPSQHVRVRAEAVASNTPATDSIGRTVIVAGSLAQAKHWAKEQGWPTADFIRHARYVPTIERFYGYSPKDTTVVFTGTWLEHDDSMEIHRLATLMGFTVME